MYREDSLRKSAINYLTINMMKSSWTLAKDDLDKIEPDTLIPHLSGKNRYSKLLIHIRTAVDDSTLSISAILPISCLSPDIYLII
ncbi:unnamed protein product [Rotaria sp. Silwood1]|nr:unnamed protein product [Rotaria sp. Silwood1]